MERVADYANSRFAGQVKTVFHAFFQEPQTMLQIEVRTGIMRANICRYVAAWKKQGSIFLVKQGKCPISKMTAGFYSTNPKYKPTGQMQMFQ